MVQHVRSGIEDDLQSFIEPLKIRDKDFDAAIRSDAANFANSLCENLCATNVVVVAIDAGYDCVLQAQGSDRLGDAPRFVHIER